MSPLLDALRDVDFNWVRPLESIWSDAQATTGGPNQNLVDRTVERLLKQAKTPTDHLRGAVLVGPAGVGKTHLVGNLRRRAWEKGAWFVLLDVLGLTDFWKSAALSYLTSLMQTMPDGRRQFETVLAGVARRYNVEAQVETAFNTPDIEPKLVVDLLVAGGLMREDATNTLRHQDVFRALCLLRSSDLPIMSVAHSWLQGYEADEEARRALGFLAPPPAPAELVRGMSWIMSLAGPTIVAVDQIDGIVSPHCVGERVDGDADAGKPLAEILAAGLLQLHDVRTRGMTVVTCLEDSWATLQRHGLQSFAGRFDPALALRGMNDVEAAEALVASRLAPAYAEVGVTPPHPTWPFDHAAIVEAANANMMPRTLLMRCAAWIRAGLEAGRIAECSSLAEVTVAPPEPAPSPSPEFDLARGMQGAEIDGLIKAHDDGEIGRLLRDVFDLYARQIEPDEAFDVVSKGDPAQKIPPLHGRLTFTDHGDNDREQHFCFRALEHSNAISFQTRLRAALTAAGIGAGISGRHLLVVRRAPVPTGAKTEKLHAEFLQAGGQVLSPTDDDLRCFVALRTMRDTVDKTGRSAGFEAWLRAEKPLCNTALFIAAGLCPPPLPRAPGEASSRETVMLPPVDEPETAPTSTGRDERPRPDSIPVGHRMASKEPVAIPTRLLPRHTSIIAGSGSGKTVLLRRIVEEAALAGIPAIVIDPNNDLSRLGDHWPEQPGVFTDEDAEKARRYGQSVEVVVWTPGLHAGNPLFLSVLPDFASFGEDRDECQQAVEMAADTLGPLAGARSQTQKGVLTEALRHFASRGGGTLPAFTSLLMDLPDDLSPIRNTDRIAAGLADQLHAAVATNPLLKADGPLLDPARLFAGPDGGRTRISVINLSGLASDAAREDFVNRLQMALFGWIKKNPSPSGRLYVVDEAQTFLPAGRQTLSLSSGLKLATQARKYGLGLIVATQVPRGIHNQIVSNCTTQFFGRQSAPATIGAAQEIIAASGGAAPDIGRLKAGEFYFATEGSGHPAKVTTPLCLTHHPANPPTPDEVASRARRSRDA